MSKRPDRLRHDVAYLLLFGVGWILPAYLLIGFVDGDLERNAVWLGGLFAATVAFVLSWRPRTRVSLRLIAIATFVIAATYIWHQVSELLFDGFGLFYMVAVLLVCSYWFFFARWRTRGGGDPERYLVRSPARTPISLAYGCAMWTAVGAPIWAEVLAQNTLHLGQFIARVLMHSGTLTAAIALFMALSLRKDKPLLLLAAVISVDALLKYLGFASRWQFEVVFGVASLLGAWWFLDRRWRPDPWHGRSLRALWSAPDLPPGRRARQAVAADRATPDRRLETARRRVKQASLFWGLLVASVAAVALIFFWQNAQEIGTLLKSYVADNEDGQARFYMPIYERLLSTSLAQSYALYFPSTAAILFVIAWPALHWKRPARLLLLRAFDRPEASRSLRRLVRSRLAGFGHVYTLADSDIRAPWYMLMPLWLGLVSFWTFRYREVRYPRDLEQLVRSMNRSWFRNINWALSWSKLFSVTTINVAWEQVVRRLLSEVDVIAIDLSKDTASLTKELAICREEGLTDRLILLFEQGKQGNIPPDLRTNAFVYGRGKAGDDEAIERRLAELLADRP